MKFSIPNLGNSRKMKTYFDRLLLVPKFKKSSGLAKYIGNFFFIAPPLKIRFSVPVDRI